LRACPISGPLLQPDDNPQRKFVAKVIERRQITLNPEELDVIRTCVLFVHRIGY